MSNDMNIHKLHKGLKLSDFTWLEVFDKIEEVNTWNKKAMLVYR